MASWCADERATICRAAVVAATGTPPDRLVAVSRLFAVPAVRGRGIGAALLAAVTAHAAGAGRRLWPGAR